MRIGLTIDGCSQETIKDVLDVGAGFGEFSCLIKNRNPSWAVSCVDFNLKHSHETLVKNNVTGINTNFLEGNFGNNYDAVSALHVVEHIPFISLRKFFSSIKNSLKDKGYLLITTPDFDSPIGNLFDYHLIYPPHHQTILSSKWLTTFLKENKLFKLNKQESASLILEKYDEWFAYYRKTAPNDETRSIIQLFDFIHSTLETFRNIEERINSSNLGAETILLFQKF